MESIEKISKSIDEDEQKENKEHDTREEVIIELSKISEIIAKLTDTLIKNPETETETEEIEEKDSEEETKE